MRELLCTTCADDYNLLKVDRDRGFQMRKVHITITMPHVKCDFCDQDLELGRHAVACTTWRTNPIHAWEDTFGHPFKPEEK